MSFMLIDTHCHLNMDEAYEKDLEAVLSRAREAGVEKMVVVGYDLPSSQRAVELAEMYKGLYATVGIHPHDARNADDGVFESLKELLVSKKVVAVGETGLDFYKNHSPRDAQEIAFRRQIQTAKQEKLPLVIHCRDAYPGVFEILRSEAAEEGVFHCYSGGMEHLKEALSFNFFISIAGPVTFPKAHQLCEAAKQAPAEKLLIETDCPYLTPQTHRGKRNEPSYLKHTAEKIAELRNASVEQIGITTSQNACELYRL